MIGAQPLAGELASAATLVVDVDPTRIQRRIDTGYCDRMADDMDEALAWTEAARDTGEGVSVGLGANFALACDASPERGFHPDGSDDHRPAPRLRPRRHDGGRGRREPQDPS